MASLFASLNTASNAMDVLGEAIGVVQNNVSNSSTDGYVTQTLNMTALPFDSSGQLSGGVQAAGVQSARNIFAEQSVWSASQQEGQSAQLASSLNSLQQFFDVSGTAGIPGTLSSLYAAFSSWSTDPTDQTAQQGVITAATNFAQTVQQTAQNVEQLRSQTDTQLQTTVQSVNSLTTQIAGLNQEIQNGAGTDAGVQAQLYSSLEQLSNLVPISVTTASDGTATVLLNGQSPLVAGSQSDALQVTFTQSANPVNAGATPDAQIVSSDGQDVTTLATEGQLGGLLSFRNQTLPAIIGDGQQQGSLNQLAQAVADRVNNILTGGQISAGPPPVAGQPLFSYSSSTPTEVASSLTLDPAITAPNLAAIAPGPPAVANGVATQLANLSDSQNSADQINGLDYTAYYANIASGIGQSQSFAASNQTTQSQLLTQAQNQRAQVSGVSLDQQATLIMQYQRSYQAAAEVVSTVNTTIQSLIAMMQQTT